MIMKSDLKVILATAKKNRITVKRAYPFSLIISRFSNGFFGIAVPIYIYYVLFNGNISNRFTHIAQSDDYVTYLVVGEALNIFCFAIIMNMGRSLVKEIREGTIESIMLSPASWICFLLGCFVEQAFRAICEFIFILLIGFVFGARLHIGSFFEFCFLLIIALISFFSFSILLACVMVLLRDTYICQNTIFFIMRMFCGIAFPIEYIPSNLRFISEILPLTHVIKLFRSYTILNCCIESQVQGIIKIICMSIVMFLLGVLCLKSIERKLVERVFS